MPSSPPLLSPDTNVKLEVPINGTASIAINGRRILSKQHGDPNIRLHVPLQFDRLPVTRLQGDAQLHFSGNFPALVFRDDHTASTTVFVKPQGKAELHLLGGQLVIDCTPIMEEDPSLTKLDFAPFARALMTFSDGEHMNDDVTIVVSADGSVLSLHGGLFMADGRAQHRLSC